MKACVLTITALILVACGNTASHLPNPLTLPGQAVATGLENAAYNARRKKVSDHLTAHNAQIISEIEQGGGPRLQDGMALARVPRARAPGLLKLLRQDLPLYRRDPEPLVVALMVHGP